MSREIKQRRNPRPARPVSIGDVCGHVTVVSESRLVLLNDRNVRMVDVLCGLCDTTKTIRAAHFSSGCYQTCGCGRNKLIGDKLRRHGGTRTKLYRIWSTMRDRCSNPNNQRYATYGAKGIIVFSLWEDFAAFQQWAVSAGYVEGLSLDRIDKAKNYEPSNCQWLSRSVHAHKTWRERRAQQSICVI
jgi:hypothetical protein